VLAGCEAGEAPPGILPELAAIHDLSLLVDATHHQADPVVRSDYSVVRAWSFETAVAWPEYVDWLQERLPDGFERRTKDARVAQFVRTLPADLQILQVTRVESTGRQFLELRLESQAF
jgi:hypothetical protein